MKIRNLVLISIICAAGISLVYFRNLPKDIVDLSSVDIYYCPMHPHVTSDKPGNCPICSMKLVKKETSAEPQKSSEKSDSEYSKVSINPQKQQLMGIKTEVVEKKTLTKTIHAYGYVAHDLELYNAQLEYIDAWRSFNAYLSRRPVKDEFRQDWRKYYLNPPAQNKWHSREELSAQQRLIKADYELRHMGINDTQFQQLQEIKYGQPWVQPDLLFSDEGHAIWIYAQIQEIDLGFIAVGQKASVGIPIYGEKAEGIVRNVSLMIDPETRTTQVRIEIPKYRGELPVNMYVDVDMPVEIAEGPVVPRNAIMDTGLRKVIFVQTGDGIFEPRTLETGFEGDGMVVVKSGLKEGETIVTSGNFLLDSESRLEASLTGGTP